MHNHNYDMTCCNPPEHSALAPTPYEQNAKLVRALGSLKRQMEDAVGGGTEALRMDVVLADWIQQVERVLGESCI